MPDAAAPSDPQERALAAASLSALAQPGTASLSAEAHEFLGRAPHWMVRSGATLFAGMFALLVVLGIVIKYPDTINGRVTITGVQPVGEVVARQSGRLDQMRVAEGQHVAKGDILAIMESPTRPDLVFRLAGKLAQLEPATLGGERMPDTAFKPEENLGKLQSAYASFLNSYNQLRSLMADDYAEKARALLRQELEGKRDQIASLRSQIEISKREVELAREKFARNQTLFDRKLLSAAQLQDEEIVFLGQQRAETTAERSLTDAEIDAAKMEKAIRDTEHERTESLRLARQQLRADFNRLRGEIDVWEADYVLRAPADGVVAFYDFWSDQQFVAAGRQVFLVVPETTQLIGRLPVKQGGAGKIRPGQTVRVRLDDFPYKEFGVVTGRVQSVSMVAREGTNLVIIDLPHPLVTSFARKIEFRQEMAGEASVVTEDIRLIGRVLYEIRRAFVNNTPA
jgi:HlyD family secretion protein